MNINSDEGMWTLDNLPLSYLKETYKFTPSPSLLKTIQQSSVRFNDGGSGSFVSDQGLVLTNHHVAMGQLQKISGQKSDYVKNGFLANSKKDELKCPDLELNILVEMEDVTQIIKDYIKGIDSHHLLESKRKEIFSKLENNSYKKTGLRSDVVELYHGGEFWLYKYKKYTDIRLVHSPELQAASFGGDSDNFQYPRYALDYAFFRVYENGKPIQSKYHLKWNRKGGKEGELLFVSGHPGSTDRQKTFSEILFLRDHSFPEYLKILEEKLISMKEYSHRGKEEERRAKGSILGIENSIKAIRGEYEALLHPETIQSIQKNENQLREIVNKNPEYKAQYGNIWETIESIQKKMEERKKEMYYQKVSGELTSLALALIRYEIEIKKPNEERYEEFRDSSLESTRLHLLTSAPIYKDKEIVTLAKSLEISKKELPANNLFLQKAIGNQEIFPLVQSLVETTNLDNLEFRKSLVKNPELIVSSSDPLLIWMRNIEPIYRSNREWIEKEIETVMSTEGGKLSDLRFKIHGRNTYPDATFTLRISLGKIQSYEVDGWKVPPYTNFYGLFERSEGFSRLKDYQLSEKIMKQKEKINLSTKINFCSTHDITGGNSGSPVLNTKGEIVGLIFDGNAYSHSLSYAYTDQKARSVSVHTQGIEEALKVIYKAKNLLTELNHMD